MKIFKQLCVILCTSNFTMKIQILRVDILKFPPEMQERNNDARFFGYRFIR